MDGSSIRLPDMPSTPEELLERLAANEESTYPLEILTEIKSRREEMIPALLQVLVEARRHPEPFFPGGDADASGLKFFLTLYLLAEFRVTAAYHPIIALLALPAETVEVLFAEIITETMGRVLASVFDGDDAPLRSLLENPDVHEYVRGAAVPQTYLCLLHNGRLTRETISDYLTDFIRHRLERQRGFIWDSLAATCSDLAFTHLIPDIKAAYEAGLCNPMFDSCESFVARTEKGGNSEWTVYARLIDDTIAETNGWGCFRPKPPTTPRYRRRNIKVPHFSAQPGSAAKKSAPKIGRNDPCPCASGKKYKKCCGA